MYLSRQLLALTAGVRSRIALVVVIGLLITAASLLSLALAGYAIGEVFAHRSLAEIWPFIAGAAAAVITRGILLYSKEITGAVLATRVKTALRTRLYRHLLELGPGYLEQHQTGQLVASAVDGVEALEIYYGKYLPQLAITVAAPVGIIAYLWTLAPAIALVTVAALFFALYVPNAYHGVVRRGGYWHWEAYASMAALVVDSLQGLPTLKAFARSRERGREIAEMATRLYRRAMQILAVNLWQTGLIDLGIAGGTVAALAVAVILAVQGQLAVSGVLVVLLLGSEIFRPIRELSLLHHQGMNGVSAAEGIFALLADQPAITDPARDTGAIPRAHSIQFEQVMFGYEDGKRPALRNFSLQVAEGETVALVGASGAGKTTVVNLLLRLFDPQAGRILVGGVDLRALPLERLRALFTTVSQDTYLFHGTVEENLRIARPNATVEEIEAAARAANALDFIARLPAGHETVVGERGLRLSGGERQRIAIARALLKDAPILLLDEPTSSVDAENEEIIQEALRRLTQGRTTIVIAHRLSTVADADRIVVMQDGAVVEVGRHQELLAARGTYARLVAAQQVAPMLGALSGGGAE